MVDPATQATIALVLAILALFGSILAISASAMVSKRLDKIPSPSPPPEPTEQSQEIEQLTEDRE